MSDSITPLPICDPRPLLGGRPRPRCKCGEPLVEVPGFDDFCPKCRQRAELVLERRIASSTLLDVEHWLKELGDAPL